MARSACRFMSVLDLHLQNSHEWEPFEVDLCREPRRVWPVGTRCVAALNSGYSNVQDDV